MSGGQDPPHLRGRLTRVLPQSEPDERDRRPHQQHPGGQGRQARGPAASGDVGREPPADDEQDRGAPIGLSPAQLDGAPVTRARQSIPVLAWVPFTDGHHHQVLAWAGEWTRNAVHLRWFDADGAWDVWTWLIAVQRATRGRIVGLPATMRPETIAYRGPRHHQDDR